MTIYEILEDIKSNRVKKVIIDSDTACEMDDQYAIAYSFACKNVEVLSLNAAPCGVEKMGKDFDRGVVMCYNEILRVCEKSGVAGKYPVYMGSDNSVTDTPDHGPVDSPAARNIINTALEAEEIIYILAMGACTNISSAIMLEPAIKEKICVIWLAGNSLEHGSVKEYNWIQDEYASRYLFECGVPFVMLPARGGTSVLDVNLATLRKYITGDSVTCKFFRDELPSEFTGPTSNEGDDEYMSENWHRVIWDLGAPGILERPEAFDLEIIPMPAYDENFKYYVDETRDPIIYMRKLDADVIIEDSLTKINTL